MIKKLNNRFLEYVSKEINLNEQKIQESGAALSPLLISSFKWFNASYELQTEWDMAKYLKMSHFLPRKRSRSLLIR